MKKSTLLIAALAAVGSAVAVQKTKARIAGAGAQAAPEPADADFVRVKEYIPDIEVELMYATDRNFTGKVIYDFTEAWLRYGTVKKLAQVQESLRQQGYRLKIWDGFRPVSAQFKLWEAYPDAEFVADPRRGFSSHSRGNTVDVTLVDMDGGYVEMPTGFDDFSEKAHRDYSWIEDPAVAEHVKLLESAMVSCGFDPYVNEWWHYSDLDEYPVGTDIEPSKE